MRLAGNVPSIDIVLQDVASEEREFFIITLRCSFLSFVILNWNGQSSMGLLRIYMCRCNNAIQFMQDCRCANQCKRYHKFHNRYVNCFCPNIWCFFESTKQDEVLNKAMQGVQVLRIGINFWLHRIKEMVMGENQELCSILI